MQLKVPVCAVLRRTHKLQVMRVESTNGQHQDIGLFLDPPTAVKVLEKVRSLQLFKPWQFKTGGLQLLSTDANTKKSGTCQQS